MVRHNGSVLEEQDIAVIIPDESIEIPIPIDVGKRGRGRNTHIRESEVPRLSAETGSRRRSRIAEEHRIAETFPDESIEIPIAIDVGEGGLGIIYHIRESEVPRLLAENRSRRRSCIAEEHRFAASFPDKSIEIPIAIDVGEGGRDRIPHIGESEVPRLLAENRSRRRSRIAVEHRIAVIFPDKSIKIPIAIDVCEGGRGIYPHIRESEVPRLLAENRSRRRSRIAIEHRIAVKIPDESIEIPIPIDVGEGGLGNIPHIGESERVGDRSNEINRGR